MLAQVTSSWLTDLDSVVLCVASLLGQVLFVERSALGVCGVVDLREDTLLLWLRLWPVDNFSRSWAGSLGLCPGLVLELD